MRKLAQKLLEERKQKAIEMVGKKIEVQIASRAISINTDKPEKPTVTFVMSTETIDRHGDIIDQASWILDHFKKNPAFFLQHNSDQFPIGKWINVWLESDPENPGKQRLVGEAEFRVKYDDAARAFDHVVEGDLNMVSVGFIPHRVDYDEERDAFILLDCELLECSLVGIGSNRYALVKNKDIEIAEARAQAIEVTEALGEVIHNSKPNEVVRRLKARDMLQKAIRRMK